MTRDYSTLTRPELEARLEVAEDVCLLFGWTPVRWQGTYNLALTEMWRKWVRLTGVDLSPTANAELHAMIPALAACREATVAHTRARIQESRG